MGGKNWDKPWLCCHKKSRSDIARGPDETSPSRQGSCAPERRKSPDASSGPKFLCCCPGYQWLCDSCRAKRQRKKPSITRGSFTHGSSTAQTINQTDKMWIKLSKANVPIRIHVDPEDGFYVPAQQHHALPGPQVPRSRVGIQSSE